MRRFSSPLDSSLATQNQFPWIIPFPLWLTNICKQVEKDWIVTVFPKSTLKRATFILGDLISGKISMNAIVFFCSSLWQYQMLIRVSTNRFRSAEHNQQTQTGFVRTGKNDWLTPVVRHVCVWRYILHMSFLLLLYFTFSFTFYFTFFF